MNESSMAAEWQLRAVIKHLEPEAPDLPPCRPRHVASRVPAGFDADGHP
jgi:hypothetical protein